MNDRRLALGQLCARFNVQILYVFGSRASEVRQWLNEEATELAPGPADVDIGVKPALAETFDLQAKVKLALALEDFFEVSRVDLVSLLDTDPFLAANIIRGEHLYVKDEYLADEYDLYILRRAGDLAPLERERMALVLGDKI